MTPASAPPAAPIKFITKSLVPCDEGRISSSTEPDNSADPAINVQDHPSPRKNNPIPSCTALSAAAVPETTVEINKSATPI